MDDRLLFEISDIDGKIKILGTTQISHRLI